MKKFFLVFLGIVLLNFVGCTSSEEAKALQQHNLKLVGIPQEIVVNICQDTNDNGSCDEGELQAKVRVNANDSIAQMWEKVKFDDKGRYVLENYNLTFNIIMEIKDKENLKYDNGYLSLKYNPDTVELSVLQALIDSDLLQEKDTKNLKELDNRQEIDKVLLDSLRINQNLLKDENLSTQNALTINLGEIAKGLLDLNISKELPEQLNECNNDTGCIKEIIDNTVKEVELTKEEAQELARSKNVVDGYIIKLFKPVEAVCANGKTYQSLLKVGEQGRVNFDKFPVGTECNITVPSGATIDSNNNGKLDNDDKLLGFEMIGSSDDTYITPLTTLVFKKIQNGERVTRFEKMIQNFNPVIAPNRVVTNVGIEKVKIEKLIVLMEVLKVSMKQFADISKIDLSGIIATDSEDTIDDLDIEKLIRNLPSEIKDGVRKRAVEIKKLIVMLKDLDPTKVSLNTFFVAFSDGGKGIQEALESSLLVALPNGMNLLDFIIKPKLDGKKAKTPTQEVIDEIKDTIKEDLVAINSTPIANAGADQTVTEKESVTLEGSKSSDSDGAIKSYEWRENENVLADTPSLTLDNLSVGTHVITLIVTDDKGAVGSDSVLITVNNKEIVDNNITVVNKPPIANAGEDQTVVNGNSVYFDGSKSLDSDGNITAYEWKEGESVLSKNISFNSSDLTIGTHTIRLIVTDNSNATASDEVVITIQKAPPPSQTEKNVADGYLIKLSSPAVASCGDNEYNSSLTVGANGKIIFANVALSDNCQIFISSGATIDSNNNGVLDDDDKVLTFSMKGSAEGSFISPLTTMLIEKEAKGEDVTELKVMVQDFNPVTCASAIASGSGVEKVKNEKLMLLMEVLKTAMANPKDANISDINISSLLQTNASESIDDFNTNALTSGFSSKLQSLISTKTDNIKKLMNTFSSLDPEKIDINSFYISVSDGNRGIEDAIRESVKVTLNATMNLLEAIGKNDANLTFIYEEFNAISSGILSSMMKPVARAGFNVSVKEGETVNLSALSSFDINGKIVSYEWKEGNRTIASIPLLRKNDFSVGVHTLTLIVTDNDGLTDTDEVVVTITPAPIPNKAPIANAGVDKNITNGTNITLDASKSYDNDGRITTYIWKEGNSVLSNFISFSKNNFLVGDHNITLTITDNDGATATDNVIITVNAIPNVAPVANAGADQNTTEGESVILDASKSSDSDGNISSFEWKEGNSVLSNLISFSKSDFVVGEHNITLSVIDNDGAKSSDSLTIVVENNNSSVNLSKGLVAHYEFEGNANDSSGNENNGTEYGGVTYSDGVIGQAGNFDGVDDYIDTTFNFNENKTDFTISYHLYPKKTNGKIFHLQTNISENSEINNDFQANKLNFYMRGTRNSTDYRLGITKTNNEITMNNWMNITVSFSKENQLKKIYIDGQLVKSEVSKLNIDIFPNSSMRIGARLSNVEYFNGLIDDLRIYNRALNEAEIGELYKMGSSTTNIDNNYIYKDSNNNLYLHKNNKDTQLTTDGDIGSFKVSPDGKRVAYIRGTYDYYSYYKVWIMNIDGSNKKKVSETEIEGYQMHKSGFGWSPDGKKILIASNPKLISVDINSRLETVILNNPPSSGYYFNNLIWKNNKIAFDIGRAWDYDREIYVMNDNGSNVKKLVENGNCYEVLDTFSSDASYIIYQDSSCQERSSGAGGAFTVYKLNIDTLNQTNLSTLTNRISDNESDSMYLHPNGYLILSRYSDDNINRYIVDKSTFDTRSIIFPKKGMVLLPNIENFDTDGDGISDVRESELGLNPNNNDSDADGYLDGIEIGDISNPTDTDNDGTIDALDLDSDNDGVSDADERVAGTNPLDKDDYPNVAPIANAGVDQNITEGIPVILDASQSIDSDGAIVSYKWKEGDSLLNSDMNFTKSDFSIGEHNITLIVTDNDGKTSSDTIIIIVMNPLDTTSFITTWKTDNKGKSNNNQIIIPTNDNYSYNYSIEWGDGSSDTNVTGDITHTYLTVGTYSVKIYGNFPAILFGSNYRELKFDSEKLLAIEQWGALDWKSMKYAFSYCKNMEINASDIPNLSHVTSTSHMFFNADTKKFHPSTKDWNVSNITDMSGMFSTTSFNEDIGKWDVSNVTDMNNLFGYNLQFNQNIGDWNVSNVKNMHSMFWHSRSFNQDIGRWNVSNVTDMSNMLFYAVKFNQNIGDWNVSNVTKMDSMFAGAEIFNQDISKWDVSNVTQMGRMFQGASTFNQDIGNWNVSKVVYMYDMFSMATDFEQNLGSWNVSSVRTMEDMFKDVTLSIQNYDALLMGWSSQSLESNLTFNAGDSQYSSTSSSARDILTDIFTWTIIDGGILDNSVQLLYNIGRDANGGTDNNLTVIQYNSIISVSGAISQNENSYQNYINNNPDNFSSPSTASEVQAMINIVNNNQPSPDNTPFITTWKTDNEGLTANNQITIPTNNAYSYDYFVDWGDGSSDRNVTGDINHTYSNIGTYRIKIYGEFPQIYFYKGYTGDDNNLNSDKRKLLSVEQWGNSEWKSMYGAFAGCKNMDLNVSDIPNLSQVTNMKSMFLYASKFNADISSWNVSNITNMDSMFTDVNLSYRNYDALLMGWSGQELEDNVTFSAGDSQYTKTASLARENLVNNFGWIITDGGELADSIAPVAPILQTILPSTTKKSNITFTFSGEVDSNITINGISMGLMDVDGNKTVTLNLHGGRNDIMVRLIDASGNVSSALNITVTRVEIFSLKKTAQAVSYTQYDDGYYEKGIAFNYTPKSEDILDRVTGLIWKDNSETNTSKKSWSDAQNYCTSLGGGWRLPTRQELSGLIRYDQSNPSIDTIFKQTGFDYYWTADTSNRENENAWAVSFSEGLEATATKSSSYFVRCVKTSSEVVANAGADQIVQEGVELALFGGYSPIADITSYEWKDNQTILGTGEFIKTSTLRSGEHNITLTVTNTNGTTDTDTILVTIVSDNRVLKRTSQSISYVQYDDGNYQKGEALNYTLKDNNILDRATGILWEDSSDTNGSTQTWQEAKNYCASKGEWRLPTRKELSDLIRYERNAPAIDRIFAHTTSGYYWTLDTSTRDNHNAWGVDFNEGVESTLSKEGSYSTRCVESNFITSANAGKDQFIEQDKSITLTAIHTPRREHIQSYTWFENGSQLGTGLELILTDVEDREHNISLVVQDKDGNQNSDELIVTIVSSDKVLKKTGQTITYTQYDDGDYEKGVPLNYVTKGTDVLDRTTGLLWEESTQTNGDTLSWDNAKAYCSAFGDGKWRLPTRKELSGLVRYDHNSPSISNIFAHTTSDYYWTIDTSNRDNDKVWGVSFDEGVESTIAKVDSYSTRCVRSDFMLTSNAGQDLLVEDGTLPITLRSTSPRTGVIQSYNWVENGAEIGTGEELLLDTMINGEHTISLTVTDSNGNSDTDEIVVTIISNTKVLKKTGQTVSYTTYDDGYYEKGVSLHYEQKNEDILDRTMGLVWQNSIDTNNSSRTWQEAKNYCASLNGNWRLPSRRELSGLVRYDYRNPAISKIFTHTANDYYWTINTTTRDNDNAWAVSFAEGVESMINKNESYLTRCIQSNFAFIAYAGADKLVEKGANIELNASNTPRREQIDSYNWFEDGNLLGETEILILSNITTGEHNITLTVTNQDSNEASDSIWVRMVANGTVLKKTGQTTSYVENDDGAYQKGATWSYSDNTDNVIDEKFGVTWQDDSDTNTLKKPWEEAKKYCSNLNLLGEAWRLPTRRELSSIINYGTNAPAIESSFDNTVSDYYWTIETSHQDNHNAWAVSFDEGVESTIVKSSENYIRCIKTN